MGLRALPWRAVGDPAAGDRRADNGRAVLPQPARAVPDLHGRGGAGPFRISAPAELLLDLAGDPREFLVGREVRVRPGTTSRASARLGQLAELLQPSRPPRRAVGASALAFGGSASGRPIRSGPSCGSFRAVHLGPVRRRPSSPSPCAGSAACWIRWSEDTTVRVFGLECPAAIRVLDPLVGTLGVDGIEDRQSPLWRIEWGGSGGGVRGVEDHGRQVGLDRVEGGGQVVEEAVPDLAKAVGAEPSGPSRPPANITL